MPILYNPPYDSPIEDSFALFTEKYFAQDVTMDTQVEVSTICGKFRPDFVATGSNGKRTAFECDGKEFHDESRDEWRDAMILGSSNIDEIYRISGKLITYQMDDLFYALSIWSPWLFDDRQKYNLSRIATKEITMQDIAPEDSTFLVHFLGTDENQVNQFYLEKRHKRSRQFWQTAFQYAQSLGGGSLDSVMEQYRSKW